MHIENFKGLLQTIWIGSLFVMLGYIAIIAIVLMFWSIEWIVHELPRPEERIKW